MISVENDQLHISQSLSLSLALSDFRQHALLTQVPDSLLDLLERLDSLGMLVVSRRPTLPEILILLDSLAIARKSNVRRALAHCFESPWAGLDESVFVDESFSKVYMHCFVEDVESRKVLGHGAAVGFPRCLGQS